MCLDELPRKFRPSELSWRPGLGDTEWKMFIAELGMDISELHCVKDDDIFWAALLESALPNLACFGTASNGLDTQSASVSQTLRSSDLCCLRNQLSKHIYSTRPQKTWPSSFAKLGPVHAGLWLGARKSMASQTDFPPRIRSHLIRPLHDCDNLTTDISEPKIRIQAPKSLSFVRGADFS